MNSAPGVGSTFQFTARFGVTTRLEREALSNHAGDLSAGLSPDPSGTGTGLPRSILVAEDHAVNQKLAVAMLKRLGHHVELAANGIEAIQKWRDGSYDLIFMDVQMPELDGLAASQRIREDEGATGAHIPIIAMTARALSGDRELCIQAGMDDYVSKPMSMKSLEEAILRHGGS